MFENYTPESHDFMVKGTAFRRQFGGGAGGFEFTITEYISCSLSWVLQMEWLDLKIIPLIEVVEN